MRSGWRKLTFWRRSMDEAQDLVNECEAFINGRYLFGLTRQHGQLPPWVWLNTLAHGDRADIEVLAEAGTGSTEEMAAARYFAREVLATADLPGLNLQVLQRELLVPIELRYGTSNSSSLTKMLCTTLLMDLRRAATIANRRAQDHPASGLRHRPDSSP